MGCNYIVDIMSEHKHTNRHWHLWVGLPSCLLMLLFTVSGLFLQHDDALEGLGVDRSLLPETYRLAHWNNGMMRGTVRAGGGVYAYGAAGVFKTTAEMQEYAPAMEGLPATADVRDMAAAADGRLFCTAGEKAYTLQPGGGAWSALPLPRKFKPSGLCLRGGELYIIGRGGVLRLQEPYETAEKVELTAPADAPQGTSLFGLVKDLHHGKLFGVFGIVLVDILSAVFIVLCISGFVFWLVAKAFPKLGKGVKAAARRVLKDNLAVHRFLGRWTLWGLVLVVFTGWLLKEPLRGAISFTIPASEASPTAWLGKSPALRYDSRARDFLLSTGSGIYSLADLAAEPQRETAAPRVSGKGMPVMLQDQDGTWLIGSNAGLYRWDRATGSVAKVQESPVGGYTQECGGVAIGMQAGAPALPMPAGIADKPVPLKQLAMDIHTGRLVFGSASWAYVFLGGLVSLLCLLTGWCLVRRRAGR